jgi:hypothetical protein
MLGFVQAALWPLLLVGAVPLLIHLLSRRKVQVVPFALVALLEHSQQQTMRHVRLRNWLLLLARTLLLLLLAAAFLLPTLEHPQTTPTDTPTAVVFVIDNTASMQAGVSSSLGLSRTLFEAAKEDIRSAVQALPEDTKVGLVRCATDTSVLVPLGFGRAELLRALSDEAPQFGTALTSSCIATAIAQARTNSDNAAVMVVVASDARRSSLGTATTADANVVVQWTSGVRSLAQTVQNHGVIEADIKKAGRQLLVTARVQPAGDEDVPLDLWAGSERVARNTIAGDAMVGSFSVDEQRWLKNTEGKAGNDAPMWKLELPADALVVDDALVLPMRLPPIIDVLIVDGAPETLPLRDEVHYLLQALRQTRGERGRIRERVVTLDRLSAADFASTCAAPPCTTKQVVVLANVGDVPDGLVSSLMGFVESGGSLWMTMGDQVNVAAYQQKLDGLLPARLRGTKELALLDDKNVVEALGLSRFNTAHPIFSMLARDGQTVPGLGRVRTQSLMLVEPDFANRNTQVLMRFTNEAPALLERVVGQGRVLLFTSTIDRDGSDLAIRPGFLPFVETTLLYLGGALVEPEANLVRVGEQHLVRVAGNTTWVSPSGRETALVADEQGRALTPALSEPGVHLIKSDNSQRSFAVAIAAAESDFANATDDELTSASPTGARVMQQREDPRSTPLWPFALALALLLLTLEAALHPGSLRRRTRAATQR